MIEGGQVRYPTALPFGGHVIRLLQIAISYIWWIWTTPRRYDKERRKSKKYKAKKKLVRDIWIGVCGVSMFLLTPATLWMAVSLSILATFLSFVILDESD